MTKRKQIIIAVLVAMLIMVIVLSAVAIRENTLIQDTWQVEAESVNEDEEPSACLTKLFA